MRSPGLAESFAPEAPKTEEGRAAGLAEPPAAAGRGRDDIGGGFDSAFAAGPALGARPDVGGGPPAPRHGGGAERAAAPPPPPEGAPPRLGTGERSRGGAEDAGLAGGAPLLRVGGAPDGVAAGAPMAGAGRGRLAGGSCCEELKGRLAAELTWGTRVWMNFSSSAVGCRSFEVARKLSMTSRRLFGASRASKSFAREVSNFHFEMKSVTAFASGATDGTPC